MDDIRRQPIRPFDSTKLGSEQIRVEEEECPADNLDRGARSRRVNRKIDIALLPFLSTLYLFNGLDRSNVGNAETQGEELTSTRNGIYKPDTF
jgi:hypothetical protein